MKQLSFFIKALMLLFTVLLSGALYLGSSHAADDSSLEFDTDLAGQESANSMTWPMLPGESVNDVARLFYPKNSALQQQFVKKTLRLNTDIELKASQRFDSPTLLDIPTIKSLSKNSAKSSKKQKNKTLNMSYGLAQITEVLPQKLLQDYELLLSKNAYLKEQLANLNEKIVFLETKLGELKLIFDKTLSLPNTNLPAENNKQAAQLPAPTEPVEASLLSSWTNKLDMDLVKTALIMLSLLLLGAFALKKYRERMFANLSFANTKTQNTVTDFSGYMERPKLEKLEPGPETIMQFQAAKEVESRLSSTLEEAKLLMSVNRGTDAIAHLKLTIESQPKASINHWLYLLEVFRKLNLKDDFENYAEQMHQTFNVMTPVWYEKEASINTVMIVPQSLEEFPHIMDQLYGVWPGELASVYLRSLITDNRGGERVGFGKAVVSEIIFLIELLDTHKDIPN